MKGSGTSTLKFIGGIVLIIIAFRFNTYAGLGLLAAAAGYIWYANRGNIYSAMGRIRYAKGDINGALNLFEKGYGTGRQSPNSLVSYGYLLLKSGNVDRSEEILNSALKMKLNMNEEMNVKSNMALVLWKRGRLDDAIEMLRSVFEKYKNSTIYGTLGYFLIQKGDLEKALEFNLEAYDYNSTDEIINDNLGQNYYMMGNFDKAAEIYEELMKKSPAFPEPYYYYGNVLFEKGKKEEALNVMEKALKYRFSNVSTTTEKEVEERIKYIREKLEGEERQLSPDGQ